MAEERNSYFDIFKGIAILGVVAVHFVQQFPFEVNSNIKDFFISGQYMVQMFFVISGYFAFYSFFKHNEKWFLFMKRKIIALIPICYVAYLIKILLLIVTRQKIHILDVLCAFTFTNGISPHYINSIGGWYIGTLVVFFAIVPILSKFITNTKKALAFFLLSFIVCFVADAFIKQFYDTGWTFYFWLPRQLPVISLGILLYFIQKEILNNSTINNGGGTAV